jgi:hypothetical protein
MSDPLCPPARNPLLIQRAPPVVGQGTDTKCWAAAMESWLRAQVAVNGPQQGKFADPRDRRFGMPNDRHSLDGYSWARRSATIQELLDTYSEIVTGGGGLVSGEALEQVAGDNGMNWAYCDILSFNKDQLRPWISFGHLYIAYFSYHMYHAIVGYGFSDDGVLAMNPRDSGSFVEITYAFLREPGRVNQKIFVGWPERGSRLTIDHAVERYLLGEWHVLIGPGGTGWSGYFVFTTDNNVYWRTFDQTNKHWGKWKREGMAVTWQFSDDDPAFMRTFRIPINADNTIPDRIQSNATTQKGTISFFTMTRADD